MHAFTLNIKALESVLNIPRLNVKNRVERKDRTESARSNVSIRIQNDEDQSIRASHSWDREMEECSLAVLRLTRIDFCPGYQMILRPLRSMCFHFCQGEVTMAVDERYAMRCLGVGVGVGRIY